MAFSASWSTLLSELEELPEDATLITPLSHDQFTINSVQEQRVIITFLDRDIDPNQPLQRDQFETMYRRITDEPDGFELDRLPPDADAYPAVWSVHPRFEIDEDQGVIIECEGPTSSQLVETQSDEEVADADRTEPDLAVYADALLLVDALERHDVEYLEGMETDALVNIYTLLSDSSVTPTNSDRRCGQSCLIACITISRSPGNTAPSSAPPGGIARSRMRRRSSRQWKPPVSTASE